MYRVLTDKILTEYNSLLGKREDIIESVGIELQKAVTELENMIINGRKLPQTVIEQIKKELTQEYCKEYAVEEIDNQISFWETYIIKEEVD